jgi:hypothetical protein
VSVSLAPPNSTTTTRQTPRRRARGGACMRKRRRRAESSRRCNREWAIRFRHDLSRRHNVEDRVGFLGR